MTLRRFFLSFIRDKVIKLRMSKKVSSESTGCYGYTGPRKALHLVQVNFLTLSNCLCHHKFRYFDIFS